MTSTSGLYGLFRLDGGPIDERDAAALDLPMQTAPSAALAIGIDPVSSNSVHRSDDAGCMMILVGDIDGAAALAAKLGLPPHVATADLARAALARFGNAIARDMLGEWTLLHWNAGRLTLTASAARRDSVFFAVSGSRCAVASDLVRIAQLPWVGGDLDEVGLLFSLGRGALRSQRGGRTMLRGVRRLLPGGVVTITADGISEQICDVLLPQPRWTGTFEDAMATARALLLDIVEERLRRTASPALLLSGGLDSSLLAWAMAERLGAGQRLHLITSVAPAGSGIPDESHYADIVADALGLSCEHVVPPQDANSYLPPSSMMRGSNGPLLSNRGPLTETFQEVARASGATLLVNGCYGEMHFTAYPSFAMAPSPTAALKAWLKRRIRPDQLEFGSLDAFHTRLSPTLRMALPDAVQAAINAPPPQISLKRAGDVWGYPEQTPFALGQPNEFRPGALRMDFPFRDIRLMRLFAGFPIAFFKREGMERAPVRQILKGGLPDSIRLRRRGMPASPGHMLRLQQHASAARTRIARHRAAGVDEWLDLDWLDIALAQIAERGARSVDEANEAQMTAINAEYLTWWRSGSAR